jgi:2-phosphosulfolactate phosphatase
MSLSVRRSGARDPITVASRHVPGTPTSDNSAGYCYIAILENIYLLGARRAHVTTPSTALESAYRFYDRTAALPMDPPAGDYVVVDVCYFSTTIVELLAGDARGVHVPETSGELFEYRATHPGARVGGEPGEDPSHPKSGHDIHNSPSFVRGADVEDRPVALTSDNGGRCVARLAECSDATVYVGTLTNAPALAAHLATRDRPTHFVAAGARGDRAPEDDAGAALVANFLSERVEFGPEDARDAVLAARRDRDAHPVRRRDLARHATAVGYRDVVPRYENDHLVDVTADRHAPVHHDAPAGGQGEVDAENASPQSSPYSSASDSNAAHEGSTSGWSRRSPSR